jgi:hypothetical protein
MKIKTIAAVIGAAAFALGVQVHAQDAPAQAGKGVDPAGPGKGGRLMQQRGMQGPGMQGKGMQGKGMQGKGMQGKGPQVRGMLERRRGAGPSLAQLDANDDGMIDLDEFLARHEDRPELLLERRDTDGDEKLSREELASPQRPARPDGKREAVLDCVQEDRPDFAGPAGIEERFDTLDSNDDSRLDAEELAAGRLVQATEQFTRLDADADGQLTPQELRAAHADRREVARSVRDCVREAAASTTP